MSSIKIRNYQKSDYGQVAAILKEADLFDRVWDAEKNLAGMTNRHPGAILVAEQEKQVVGSLFVVPYGAKVAYLFRLAVKKDFRRQGIASRLIDQAQKIVKKRETEEIGLYVEGDNQELQEFYKKRGFKMSWKQYYYMWKELR